MKVLSLFDGMSCGQIAFKGLGFDVENYYAYEIDKYAIKVTQHNFPDTAQCGNVFDADFTRYTGIDWLIGGSPCTYWSIAQTKNRETVASGIGWELFSQYVRALREAKPKYFLYENNKSMSKDIRRSIDEAFGFEAICINSTLVSAQNRQRLYWVGRRNEDGSYSKVDVEQPEDRGIRLRDILETTTGCARATNGTDAFNDMQSGTRLRVAEPACVSERGRNPLNPSRRVAGDHLEQRYEARTDAKTNTLTTVQKDNMVAVPTHGNDKANTLRASYGGHVGTRNLEQNVINNGRGYEGVIEPANGKTARIYEVRDGMIAVKNKTYPIKLADGYYTIRKLTIRECMRLQTVPEWYDFSCISNSQAYKCLGNGWTVEVIKHLINKTLT